MLEPVLGHEARGFAPPFEGAAPGDGDDYAHLASGRLEPGIQTGFCCSTGGGWAPELVAHETQLHRIADDVPDERAVLIEPLAGGIHAALKAGGSSAVSAAADPIVAVLGAGTMGLAAVAGLVRYVPHARVVVGARYPHQQRAGPGARRPRRRRPPPSSPAPCAASSAATSSATTSRRAPTPPSTPSAARPPSARRSRSPGPAAVS